MATGKRLTGVERTFEPDEIIVTKTDLKGRILYANDVFLEISGYSEEELLGQPHSMIRHPDMPRAVFKLLWDRIEAGLEVFAFVVNLSKSGDHYWVLAHVTPSVDSEGVPRGYHSNRRAPAQESLEVIRPLYRILRDIEKNAADPKTGLAASSARLTEEVARAGFASYDRFVLSLAR